MEIEASVLGETIADEYDWMVATEEGCVVVTENFAAGFWHPDEFDSFVRELEWFVAHYTKEWVVDSTDFNRIEGYHRGVLVRECDSV